MHRNVLILFLIIVLMSLSCSKKEKDRKRSLEEYLKTVCNDVSQEECFYNIKNNEGKICRVFLGFNDEDEKSLKIEGGCEGNATIYIDGDCKIKVNIKNSLFEGRASIECKNIKIEALFKNGLMEDDNAYFEAKKDDKKVKYSGGIKKYSLNGKGIFSFEKGASFSGTFKNNVLVGDAFVKYPDGVTYRGTVKNFKKQGKGELIHTDGTIIRSNFINGEPEGLSFFEKGDTSYIGNLEKGLPIGCGYQYLKDTKELYSKCFEKGKSIHRKSKTIEPPLVECVKKRNAGNCLTTLLEQWHPIDFPDKNGDTPLIVAVRQGDVEIVRFLLKNGAKKYLQNKKGQTAYDVIGKNKEIDALFFD